MKYVVDVAGTEYRVDVRPAGRPGAYVAEVNGQRRELDLARVSGAQYSLILDGLSFDIAAGKDGVYVDGRAYRARVWRDTGAAGRPAGSSSGPATVTAPMPGLAVAVHVKVGDPVEPGQTVVVIEAMKMH